MAGDGGEGHGEQDQPGGEGDDVRRLRGEIEARRAVRRRVNKRRQESEQDDVRLEVDRR